jgi:hypothetical protein
MFSLAVNTQQGSHSNESLPTRGNLAFVGMGYRSSFPMNKPTNKPEIPRLGRDSKDYRDR